MKTNSASLVTRAKTNPLLAILVSGLLLLVVLMGVILYKLFSDSQRDQAYLSMVSDLRASSYQLTSLSRDATGGNEQAFGELQSVVAGMDNTWQRLRASDGHTRVALADRFAEFDGIWSRIKGNSQEIINNKETIVFLHDVANTLNESLPELQSEHNNIVEILLENNAPAEQVSVAQNQSWLAERIGRNVDKMLVGGVDADKSADQFNIDASVFGVDTFC